MKKRIAALLIMILLFTGISPLPTTKAETFVFPASLTVIGEEAFAGDTALTAMSVGNTVRSIGSGAFRGCTGLTDAVVLEGVESIGAEAFRGCTSLKRITVTGKNTVIGTDAFDADIVILCPEDSAAALWADGCGILWMPIGSGIKANPVNATAEAGETVSFRVTALGAAAYQWQVKRGELDWTNTYLSGYDTDTLSMEAVFSRCVLQWRCLVTLKDGTQLYSESAHITLATASSGDIEVKQDSKVIYDVPLYDQGNSGICWSVSMQMVNDWMMGLTHTLEEAYDLSYERAESILGENVENGLWPYDVNDYVNVESNIYTLAEQQRFGFSEFGLPEPDAENVYQLLVMYGPAYVTYGRYSPNDRYLGNRNSGHIVVLTGIDLETGKLYTNNPWGIEGAQNWEQFEECFEMGEFGVAGTGTWEMERVQGTDWVEWGPEDIPEIY